MESYSDTLVTNGFQWDNNCRMDVQNKEKIPREISTTQSPVKSISMEAYYY